MEQKAIKKAVEKIKARFEGIYGIRLDSNGILLGDAADGGEIDGLPAADYYGEFRRGYPWVNPKLEQFLDKLGYMIEWYDPGTLVAGVRE